VEILEKQSKETTSSRQLDKYQLNRQVSAGSTWKVHGDGICAEEVGRSVQRASRMRDAGTCSSAAHPTRKERRWPSGDLPRKPGTGFLSVSKTLRRPHDWAAV
jgi:hypothetical protein